MLKNFFALLLTGVLWSAAVPAFAQDLTPPIVAITAPIHNSYVNSLPAITGTAADDIAVSSVQVRVQRQSDGYYWDGAAFTAAQAWLDIPVLPTSPVSWTYSTVPAWLNGAAYEVNARAGDEAGNWSVPYATAAFHYDTVVPVSRVVSPATGPIVSSFTAINGTAWDNESFPAQVWVKIDRADDDYYWNGALSQWTAAEAWNLAVGSAVWTYTGLAAGDLAAGTTYTAVSRAADLAGNVEVSTGNPVTFLYDPQVLSSAAFSGVWRSSLTVNWGSTFGAGTTYYVRLSTGADPGAYVLSASSTSAYYDFTGLTPDTSYYGFVSTMPASGFVASGEGVTLAYPPGHSFWLSPWGEPTEKVAHVSTGTMIIHWDTGDNPDDTRYLVEASTDPDSFVAVASYTVYGASSTVVPVSVNTAYSVRVSAVNRSGVPALNSLEWPYGTGHSIPDLPSNVSLSSVAYSSATITWDTGDNPAWTIYEVRAATSPAFHEVYVATFVPFSMVSATNYAVLPGLWTDTTYYVDVAAGPGRHTYEGYQRSLPLSFYTVPGPDGSPAGSLGGASDPSSDVLISGILPTLREVSLGVPASAFASGTRLAVAASTEDLCGYLVMDHPVSVGVFTDGDVQPGAGMSLAISYNTGAENTASINWINLNLSNLTLARYDVGAGTCVPVATTIDPGPRLITSTITATGFYQLMLLDRQLSSAAFSGVWTSSLTVNWGSTFDAGMDYYVRLSTHEAAAPYIAMATTTALSYEFIGLTPDTTYYGFVSTSIASGYIASGAGLTLAAAPSSAAFTAVAYSSAALAWSVGSNPAHTVYEFQVHTSTDFSSFTSSGTLAATSAWSGGLEQGTTYYGRVRALNSAGAPTAYAYGGPAVTARLYAAGAPAGVAGVTLGVSSISWSWNSGTLSSADYFIAREAGVSVSTQPFGATGAFIQEGLVPNTTYLLSVTGANANGETAAAVSPVVYTLAAQPASLTVPYIAPSSAALTWTLNGNAAGTLAQLWRSPDDASYTNVYEGAALSYADAALEECTLYYYKARNINGAALPTSFTAPLSFTTTASTPSAPGGLYAEALDGARIALTWEPSPSTTLVTQYRLYFDNATGTIDYVTPYTAFSSTVTSWTTPALTAGNTYKFAVRAVTRCGVEEANTSAAYAQAVGVLSGVRAAIKVPQTGKRIKGNSVTIVAELALGLPSQVKNVRFQYRLAGNVAWTDVDAVNVNHPNPDTAAPYFVHWDADAMAAGTYELRALATDVFDAADPAPPIVTVIVDPVDFDTSESVLAGQMQKEQKIVNTVPSTVQAGDDATALLSKVVIPAGAVSVTTAAVTLIPNPPARPAPPAGSGDLAIAVKINLSNGQSQLAGGNSAVITLSYKDDDGDGVVDGTTAEVGRLRVYAASDTGTSWTPLASTVDRTAKTVSAPTTHFSFFSAFATPAAGLSSMKAYPNPWQPGAGGRFDAAAVTFTGLPNEARIKIFTILGELVRQIDVTAADAGTKTWDGRNSNGSKAASGVYLVRVESGGDDRTLKLAVER